MHLLLDLCVFGLSLFFHIDFVPDQFGRSFVASLTGMKMNILCSPTESAYGSNLSIGESVWTMLTKSSVRLREYVVVLVMSINAN